MEPLSALGVAAAAVQFLDFGSGIISDFQEIYKSPQGQTRELVELSTVSKDLAGLAGEIEAKLNSARLRKISEDGGSSITAATTDSEEVFYRLCGSCREIGTEIQERVSALQAKGTSKLRLTASSFYVALKAVCSENEIRNVKTRLYQVRQQMMMAILVHFW